YPGRRNSPDIRSRTRLLFALGLLQRGELAFGQHQTLPQATLASSALSRFFIVSRSWRCQTPRTPAGEIEWPSLRSSLAIRPVQRKLDDDRLNLGRRAVLQDRFAPRQLLQRQFAAGVVKLLEAIETVARVAHHFAGLADIAELPGHLQQPYF